jgi:hypothetical protein
LSINLSGEKREVIENLSKESESVAVILITVKNQKRLSAFQPPAEQAQSCFIN